MLSVVSSCQGIVASTISSVQRGVKGPHELLDIPQLTGGSTLGESARERPRGFVLGTVSTYVCLRLKTAGFRCLTQYDKVISLGI